jgi:membrane protease YdiL (CAAX protease family)
MGHETFEQISVEGRGMVDRPTLLTLFGLLVALGFPALPVGNWVNQFANVGNMVGYEAIWWAVVAFMLAYVRLVERRPLGSIGLRAMRMRDGVAAIAAGVATLTGLAIIYYVVFPRIGVSENSQMGQLLVAPAWWRASVVVRAAVSEELLFRGYGISRLEEITRSRVTAALLSGAVFTIVHVGFWGWGHLLIAGYAAAVLTALWLWRRNLWSNIIAHAIVDGTAFLAG